ncbi:MAG: outer membrane beta-barrel protein [Gammaproteobacteria bacterium]|jgi:outer membrane protein|nr:outer membrane beta-barrel protein [Gammaproteobacteria bacterium]
MARLYKLLVVFLGLALVALPAQAYEKGDWIFRAGYGVVDPQGTAATFTDEDLGSVFIDVDSGSALTLEGVYFFSPNWSFEILAATPFKHDVKLGVSTDQDSGTAKIGEVSQLPPTFTFQYHFMPDAAFRPYVGLGLNWTTFFDEQLVSDLTDQGLSLSVDDSFGAAIQLAADVPLGDKWLLNFDIRWISLEADANLSDGVDTEVISLDISPLVYSINLGYRF